MALEMTRHMIQSGAVFARAANDMKLKERLGNAWRGRGLVAAVAVADHARENADLEDIKDKVKADKVKAFAYSAMVVATVSYHTPASLPAVGGIWLTPFSFPCIPVLPLLLIRGGLISKMLTEQSWCWEAYSKHYIRSVKGATHTSRFLITGLARTN